MALPAGLSRKLGKLLGPQWVDKDPADLLVYQSDGLTLHAATPDIVVYPETTEQCARIIKTCASYGAPFVARGAGTGLSGGAISDGGVIIQLSRMNRVLQIDHRNRFAIVQPGVVNNYLNLQVRPFGLEFAPDPSSQAACTIGGNVAENAGGPHTLKYGVTSNHILGQTVVFADGSIEQLGGTFPLAAGPDFSAFLVGTEGTIAITTEVIVRLTPLAPSVKTMLATFPTVAGATESVSAILSAGVLPAALEIIDNLCIQAVEAHLKAGFPTEAAAILLIELDGEESEIANESAPVEKACRQNGATDFRVAQGEDERQQLWRGRKHAVGSLGKLSPAFYTNDGVVPRSKLTTILNEIYRIGNKHSLRVANVCHAGDGSMHPLILFDPNTADGAARAMECSEEILLACLEIGGSITGEHGVGVEKRHLMNRMFSARDLEHMARLRAAFNPRDLLNPGKVLPGGATRREVKAGVSIPGGSWI